MLDASTTPGGSAPLVTAKVPVADPPVATSLSAYGRPTMARGRSDADVNVNGTPNVAPTVRLPSSFTVQAAVPEHAPLQPRNCAPAFGSAVRETLDPRTAPDDAAWMKGYEFALAGPIFFWTVIVGCCLFNVPLAMSVPCR